MFGKKKKEQSQFPIKQLVDLGETGCIKIFNLYLNYGRIKIKNDHKIDLLFPQQFISIPYVFISPSAKGTLFNNKSNSIYISNITNQRFSIISQTNQRLNDIAEYISWFAIGFAPVIEETPQK